MRYQTQRELVFCPAC